MPTGTPSPDKYLEDIYRLLLEGKSGREIRVHSKREKWPMTGSAVARHIHEAREMMREDLELARETALPEIIMHYRNLLERALKRNTTQADWLAVAVLKDIAALLKVADAGDDAKWVSSDALIEEIVALSKKTGVDISL